MNNHPPEDISLRLLDELTKESVITQRALADRLGIALGLVNAYVKRLYNKGHIKVKNLPRNRVKYIITPKGFAEKAKLTYSYMNRSIDYFRDVRQKIEQTYAVMMASDVKNILLWGDGEVAELCYISTRGLPLKIVGVVATRNRVVADSGMEKGFFGHDIYSIENVNGIEYDAILVASLDGRASETMNRAGVNPERVYYL
ncbi:MAG: winged helix-turn-helix transcriptional regulator [Nitrospirae bacterium]|nr:winged helix-turn-helix transcriptional regulator [Nitrospirota bacterium]